MRKKRKRGSSSAGEDDGGEGPLPLCEGELMHSTRAESVSRRKWLALAPRVQEREPSLSYCSCDGSSTGWHACVFVPGGFGGTAEKEDDDEGGEEEEPLVHLRARWGDMKGTRNVGAEASAFLLGVQTVARHYDAFPSGRKHDSPGSEKKGAAGRGSGGEVQVKTGDASGRVVFLADFLNALAWDVGAAKYKHDVLVATYAEVERVKARLRDHVSGGAGGLRWSHVHHPGHQTDDSWYTHLNLAADNLASLGMEVDCRVPLSVLLGELTARGADAADRCKAAIEKGLAP